LRSNSRGKKLEVKEHRRSVKLLKNKMSVTAFNDSLNATTVNVKSISAILNATTVNVKSISAMCAKCVMIDKHDLCVPKSVAKPLRKTVASESIKKPRNNVRKLHEHFGKIYKWSYIKFTPSGYIWKPKSGTGNENPNVSMPLDYIPGPEEPAQAPPSPDYVPGPEHADDEIADEEEEEEHPTPADSVVVASTTADQAPSAEETEPFETDQSAATPPPHPAYR
nr:hypothetical protein [Tanacetum cinerariifolium]